MAPDRTPLDIAAMRRRLVLELPADIPDGAGGVTRSWTQAAVLWAAVEPTTASPALVADAPATLSSVRITLRWRPDITAAARLRDGARLYRIRAVTDPDGRRAVAVVAADSEDA